jgi:type I restriction enzyme, S subunit
MSQEEIVVPKGWESKKLSEICSKITDGAHKTPTYVTDGIPFLRVKDIHLDQINWNNTKRIPKQEHDELIKRCKPEKGDILYSKNGTIGLSKIVDWENEFSIFVSLALLKPKKELVESKFLKMFLDSTQALSQTKKRSKSVTVTNLHLEEIREMLMPIPSIPTQKQIVAKLDHILGELEVKKEKIISIIEQNKQRIDFFEKNFFSQIMKKYLQIDNVPETWTVKSLGNIATRIGGGTPKKNNDEYYQGDIPWFTISDLSNEITFPKIIHNSKMKITEKAIKESSAKKIPKNAVILGTRVGVGKLAIAGREVTTNQDFSSFVCSKEIEPYFLGCYFLAIRQHLQQKSRGLTVKGIITSELDNLSIGYPSNEEQTKIIQNIKSAEEKFQTQKKKFENIKNNYESKIKYINHIQSSVLDSAFSGKLIQ